MKSSFRLSLFAVGALGLVASPAAAEVMDKEWALEDLWLWAAVGSLLGYLACRARGWLFPLSLLVASFVPLSAVLETRDTFVGPAIRSEAGLGYVVQAHLLLGLVLAANLLGLVGWLRARRRRRHVAA